MRVLNLVLSAAIVAGCLASASAQDEDDEDFPPGMLARYTSGDRTVERVDPDVTFVWGEDAPDPRLPAGPFKGAWESLLLVRQPGEYRFHAYVSGEAVVEVDRNRVLAGRRGTAGWIDGDPVTLGFGEQPLKVTYHSPATQRRAVHPNAGTDGGADADGHAAAQIRLFWSSDSFPLEPVPAHLLYRDGGNPELDLIERGRVLFDTHRCGRCHLRKSGGTPPAAPALTHLGSGTNREWIRDKVQGVAGAASSGNMPQFGFTQDEAAAVAAFLMHSSHEANLSSPGKSKDAAQDRREGEVLFHSLGCLACHTIEAEARRLGTDGPYGGGDLSAIGAKRSLEWLTTWLADPEQLNADHRMPVFDLSSTERRQLVLYLSSLGSTDDAAEQRPGADRQPPADDELRTGRELVERARCAACHRIPGVEIGDTGNDIPDLSRPAADWRQSCLSDVDMSRRRPVYTGLSPADAEALKACTMAYAAPLAAESRFDHGRRTLERRNCLACHERDTAKGIAGLAARVAEGNETLRGQSQGLIPPALTAVGDKFIDEALGRAVSGEQQKRRLPWLFVRMPRFNHSPDDKLALLAYLVDHDRIPEHPQPGRTELPSVDEAANDDELLIAGHTLVGAKGFSCVACHHVGEFAPRNVALGTRGSDLLAVGRHMRESYFLRWTRSPIRIVPGMEMPSILKPVPEVLDGTIDTQLSAIWQALNDPRFTVPTDPSSVEQYLVVRPGERPRIVRDVFTNPEENGGGYVPRALAIGFPNGHSVLYDLDTFAVRGWYFGDFARQRTLGKSWYWDMAGVQVMTGFERRSDFSLRPARSSPGRTALIQPRMHDGACGRLLRYATEGDAIRVDYELDFEWSGQAQPIRVTESVRPVHQGTSRNGWERRIVATNVADGCDLLVSTPAGRSGLGAPDVQPLTGSQADDAGWVKLHPAGGETRQYEAVLRYDASIELPAADIPPRPSLPAAGGPITTVPGFDGIRLPLEPAIMPTSITWTADGTLAFTSLKGHVLLARDTDGDGIEDSLSVFEEGLAAPYGLLADGTDLLVAHKPEVLRLRDTDRDGRADVREVIATGWGYNDNYHDWTTGFARDTARNLYIGIGSDYAQADRPRENGKWRGKVLKVAPDGTITPIAHGFRYPMGLAINAAGDLFATDNQGVQNTFNEINHIVPGGRYGVPARWENDEPVSAGEPAAPAMEPAVQVPHPWTRSVNGIAFVPVVRRDETADRTSNIEHPTTNEESGLRLSGSRLSTIDSRLLADHGIGTEYDSRFLVRFTLEEVGGAYQGGVYHFSQPDAGVGGENFSGPLCIAVAPSGDLYIGSIHDSGWLGGQNTGEIVRLRPNGQLPNGIRELRATADGFQLEFFGPVDRAAASRLESYTISGYTRVWGGAYATPDTGRHKLDVKSARLSDDGRTVRLTVPGRKTGHVYEVTCTAIGIPGQPELWPATGHYTLHRIPGGQ